MIKFLLLNLGYTHHAIRTQSSQDDHLVIALSLKHMNVTTKYLFFNLHDTPHAIRTQSSQDDHLVIGFSIKHINNMTKF